jgi:histidine triad (HIT) family protein
MFHHEPKNYVCPFCQLLADHDDKYNCQDDIITQNKFVTLIVAPRWWVNNPGNVLVIPNKHFENIYELPDDYLTEIYKMAKKAAIALKEVYGCDGTSTRQHNEPAGGQDVWHLHVQVLPRYAGDELYLNDKNSRFADAHERKPYADKLRAHFADHQ